MIAQVNAWGPGILRKWQLNTSMAHCHSAHRCARLDCPACVWRHSLHVTRRILTASTGPLYTITLTLPDLSPSTILTTRIQVRNSVDHLRRRYPPWRDLSLHLWLTRSGNLEGIASLGTLGPAEVQEKLGSRRPMKLCPIVAENLRVEVYRTLLRVWVGEGVSRRYQPVSLYVGPRRVQAVPECQNNLTFGPAHEPMPLLIG